MRHPTVNEIRAALKINIDGYLQQNDMEGAADTEQIANALQVALGIWHGVTRQPAGPSVVEHYLSLPLFQDFALQLDQEVIDLATSGLKTAIASGEDPVFSGKPGAPRETED